MVQDLEDIITYGNDTGLSHSLFMVSKFLCTKRSFPRVILKQLLDEVNGVRA